MTNTLKCDISPHFTSCSAIYVADFYNFLIKIDKVKKILQDIDYFMTREDGNTLLYCQDKITVCTIVIFLNVTGINCCNFI